MGLAGDFNAQQYVDKKKLKQQRELAEERAALATAQKAEKESAPGYQEAQFQKYMAEVQKQRAKDLRSGAARGEALFGKDAMGRVQSGRAEEITNLLNRRLAESQGLTPEEQTAAREQGLQTINRGAVTQQREMASNLARQGIRGPAAAAALANIGKSTGQQKAEAERDLFLKNIDLRRAGLSDYEKSLGGAREEELGREKFNIGQKNKEMLGKLTTELGYGSLGAGERAAVMQRLIGEGANTSAAAAANQGGKK